MTTTYRLTSIEHAVQIGTTLTGSWYRGHSRPHNQLTPRIYRPEITDELVEKLRPDLELAIIDTFKREAPALTEVSLPQPNDKLGWLYLMQHYRTPTRLLDWSKNVLVALHFAVCCDDDRDGELWVMFAQQLNQESHVGPGMPLIENNPVLRFLIEEPYWSGSREALAGKLEIGVVPNRPVAFEPTRRFARLVRQAGTFTIHPRQEVGHTIPEILTDQRHLVRYLIPSATKRHVRKHLAALGIDDYALFPELEGLSKRIVSEAQTIAYSPPEPPTCGGLA